mgnify:CR=1 FL=1
MSFIKLTSFESWKSESSRSGDGCPPDLLINPDHVLRVTTADYGNPIEEEATAQQ